MVLFYVFANLPLCNEPNLGITSNLTQIVCILYHNDKPRRNNFTIRFIKRIKIINEHFTAKHAIYFIVYEI